MPDTLAQRDFVPGTTGWSVEDLDDPAIEALWNAGHYEIVEGVLTTMPPAYFDSGYALQNLIFILRTHVVANQLGGGFATEVDLILGKHRLPCADAVYLSTADQERQKETYAPGRGSPDLTYGRILVPPTLVIEALSKGHESHDRETKRRWYAEAAVPHYWLIDAPARSLECLILDGRDYRTDVAGQGDAELRPGVFPGLLIPLGTLWAR